MWVEYGVTVESEYGMTMHVDFTANGLKGTEVVLAAYFQYTNNPEEFLPDRNQRYYTVGGSVAASTKITPQYDASVFTDVQVFIPYAELDLDAGTHELTINLQLVYPVGKGGTIAWLKQHDIIYTQQDESRGAPSPGATINKSSSAKAKPAVTTGPRATFDKMWVDHNVKGESGQTGLLIHLKFVTYDMKDVEADVAVFFDHNDGTGVPLKDKNNKYRSRMGNVAVFKTIYPGYATAYYDDLQLFMPYEEFDLGAGKHPLSFEAMLIYPNGTVIAKFGWYDFDYTNPGR
jgi:hypothetical protein